ncbi:thrombospondin-related apical membrane protein, putative [Plasmodium gallinaceum]|uniref:Thrombospondin-related apical membrane protein, putative n=1 Tax=Plasmodium gallinaceum TaxID=5849 RepID=A0A1J1GYW6_PLAGA|nr:thrombospondin-related apical membrane protein, putative [Plasmodium gallinaceum]CRG97748.1 thrombospondin-related apical membrane protein, putative [Plasmodium gallinaceum]
MLKFFFYNLFYIFLYYKGIISDNFKLRNNENFIELLQKNGNYKIEILEPECTSESNVSSDQIKESYNFDRKEFLMHDFVVVKNSQFSNDTALELYHLKEKKKTSYLVLTFYIGDFKFPEGDSYEANLILNVVPVSTKNTCKHNTYIVSLLKTIDVNNPSEFEISKGPLKITISKTSGSFRINVTNFFKDDKWRAFSKNKISFLLKPEDYCYTKLENKLNKPSLIVEKKTIFYTEWGEWSSCSMTCDHPDNVQIRERQCIRENDDCFQGDLKESKMCEAILPKCSDTISKSNGFSTLKIILIILPLLLIICILLILYHIFYRKKGAEKELYENVAGRFMYD